MRDRQRLVAAGTAGEMIDDEGGPWHGAQRLEDTRIPDARNERGGDETFTGRGHWCSMAPLLTCSGSAVDLVAQQLAISVMRPEPWRWAGEGVTGGCFVCFGRGKVGAGAKGDPGWAGAALVRDGEDVLSTVATGEAGAPYVAGLLVLREGSLLESAVRALPELPEVLVVDATGRDHPRRAGLALHLGAVLGVPTVGVTHRPLLADGEWPTDKRGARSPLLLDGEVVGYWVRTRPGTRPLACHAAWRTDPDTAAEVVLGLTGQRRTPEPLRQARTAARRARAGL